MVQKELRKISQWFCKGFLKWYDGGGGNGITSKMIFLKLKCFSPIRMLTSPLFEETIGAFLFLPLFFSFFLFNNFSLFFFYAPSLEELGCFDDIWGKKSLLQKFSFQMEGHGHDCGYTGGGRIFRNGVMHANIAKPWLWRCGSVDICVEVCMPIFLGEASK
jgi:hypothetical protein